MLVKIGVDVCYLPKFEKSLKRGGKRFLSKLFHVGELGRDDVEHLGGIFAAKEAVLKTSILPSGSWKKIEINYSKDGRPKIAILDSKITARIEQLDVSISHDGDYAFSCAILVLKQKPKAVG